MRRNGFMDMDPEGNNPIQDAIDAEVSTSSDSGDEDWHSCNIGSDSDFKESNDYGEVHESSIANSFTAESA